jgi:hypothetical protein
LNISGADFRTVEDGSDDGATVLLQSDYDQAAFALACGAIAAPDGWDGLPSGLGGAWAGLDCGDITACPDDYRDLATVEEPAGSCDASKSPLPATGGSFRTAGVARERPRVDFQRGNMGQ